MLSIHLLSQGGALFALGGFMLFIWGLLLVASIFWIWMLIDCLTSSMPTNEKVLWFLVIFFLHLIGAIIYYAVRKGGSHSGRVVT